jgi:hypothetical protein
MIDAICISAKGSVSVDLRFTGSGLGALLLQGTRGVPCKKAGQAYNSSLQKHNHLGVSEQLRTMALYPCCAHEVDSKGRDFE